ncbi:MAG TPA: hypothetical protein VIR31_05865 [Nitrososphaeraceae archaeon]
MTENIKEYINLIEEENDLINKKILLIPKKADTLSKINDNEFAELKDLIKKYTSSLQYKYIHELYTKDSSETKAFHKLMIDLFNVKGKKEHTFYLSNGDISITNKGIMEKYSYHENRHKMDMSSFFECLAKNNNPYNQMIDLLSQEDRKKFNIIYEYAKEIVKGINEHYSFEDDYTKDNVEVESYFSEYNKNENILVKRKVIIEDINFNKREISINYKPVGRQKAYGDYIKLLIYKDRELLDTDEKVMMLSKVLDKVTSLVKRKLEHYSASQKRYEELHEKVNEMLMPYMALAEI